MHFRDAETLDVDQARSQADQICSLMPHQECGCHGSPPGLSPDVAGTVNRGWTRSLTVRFLRTIIRREGDFDKSSRCGNRSDEQPCALADSG